MKLLILPALAGICFAAAIVNPFDPLICFDPSPNRISATTTTSRTQSSTSSAKGWVTTGDGLITSYDYNDASSTVWVFPTGSGNHEATKVIYEGVQVISVSFVVIIIEAIDSQTMTMISSDSSSTSIHLTASTSTSASAASSYPTTITQSKATHVIDVGTGRGFAYNPSWVNASIGDTVRFNFLGRNHSVTQSDLASPCTSNGGFDTGLNQFNPLNISGKFVVDFQVNVSTPLWFYW
jgi:plastocyanin